MAVGLPSLGCDDVPVVVELLDDGCGVLSRGRGRSTFSTWSACTIGPSSTRRSVRAPGGRVERHYSLDRVVEIYFDLYRELAGDSRGK